MTPPNQTPPFWSTASFGDSTDTSPMELSALGEHLDVCKGTSSRWFALQCVGEALHGFITARFRLGDRVGHVAADRRLGDRGRLRARPRALRRRVHRRLDRPGALRRLWQHLRQRR